MAKSNATDFGWCQLSKHSLSQSDIEFIKNILRKGTTKWPGRAECLRRARKKVKEGCSKNGQPKFKYFWQCARCEQWYRDEKEMEVDHIDEIGSFTGDWNVYVGRVYTSQDNLQCLCIACHLKKTKAFNSAKSKWVRK